MYKGPVKKMGLRCRICTGCGLCPGVTREGLRVEVLPAAGNKRNNEDKRTSGDDSGVLYVLAEDALSGEKRPFGDKERRLVTADVGTTTIAMLLYGADGTVADRYAAVNPQTVYGADVISRIRAAQDPARAAEMRSQVTETLEKGVRRFGRHPEAAGKELRLVLAANTVMTCLLLGADTEELGHAPFAATHLGSARTVIGEAPCFVFPGISAFVGGDILAGIYACGMAEREELTLLVDLGTNGEIVLGNRAGRIACATAAGPAFEGGVNRGIWGADMMSLVATLLKEGIVDDTGLMAEEYFEKGIRIGNVTVTQEAIRSIQPAKAAIAAGMEILLNRYGVTAESVDRVILAGGFGYYLKPWAAARTGLLPEALAKKAVSGGNTALAGALAAGRSLFDGEDENALAARLEKIAAGTEVLNLAEAPEFEEKYIRAMNFGG